MAEYIKRDAALKALCQVSAPTPSESYIVEKCIEKINRLPMMEVVRCKDCKYGVLDTTDDYGWHLCCYDGSSWNKGNHFCSYGERREGE